MKKGSPTLTRALLIVGIVVLLIAGGVVAVMVSNNSLCSTAERRAMSEFAHYDGADLVWESNLKATGGCTTTYTIAGDSGDVLRYYQGQLAQHGWKVQPPPANTFPPYLEVERGELQYFLMFEGPDSTGLVGGGAEGLKGGTPLASASVEGPVSPGQTRVTIMGGHKD